MTNLQQITASNSNNGEKSRNKKISQKEQIEIFRRLKKEGKSLIPSIISEDISVSQLFIASITSRRVRKAKATPIAKKSKSVKVDLIIEPKPVVQSVKNKPRIKYDSSLPKEYKIYLIRSTNKKIAFELTIEQFYAITEQKCHYCGNDGKIGIDREDCKKGYILSNCVPCCFMCNMMKHTFTRQDFIQHIKRIYQHQFKTV